MANYTDYEIMVTYKINTKRNNGKIELLDSTSHVVKYPLTHEIKKVHINE